MKSQLFIWYNYNISYDRTIRHLDAKITQMDNLCLAFQVIISKLLTGVNANDQNDDDSYTNEEINTGIIAIITLCSILYGKTINEYMYINYKKLRQSTFFFHLIFV